MASPLHLLRRVRTSGVLRLRTSNDAVRGFRRRTADDRDARRLRHRSEARGAADVRGGALDTWSFDGVTLPYLDLLDRQRESAVAKHQARSRREQDRRRGREAAERLHRERHAEQIAHLVRDEAEACTDVRIARARIDRIATAEVQSQSPAVIAGHTLTAAELAEIEAEAEVELRDVLGDAGHRQPSEPAPYGTDGQDTGNSDGDLSVVEERRRRQDDERWEGEHGGSDRAVSRGLSLGLLALLALVEFPVQYTIFQRFTTFSATERTLTIIFVLPMCLLLILAPHVVGRRLRARHATGEARRLTVWLAVITMALTVAVYVVLGYLRAQALLVTPTRTDPETGEELPGAAQAPAELLHISDSTVIVMFVALLLLGAGISLVLGLARQHPLIAAYLGAKRRRDRAATRLARARAAGSRPTLTPTWRDEEWRQHIADGEVLIRARYVEAAQIYLDAAAHAARDATITQAITGLTERRGG